MNLSRPVTTPATGWRRLVPLVLLILASIANSQSVSLTPEQQSMLDQLPPAQREQALRALQRVQQQNGQGSNELSSLSEELSQATGPFDADAETIDPAEESRALPGSQLVVTVELKEASSLAGIELSDEDPALQRMYGTRFYELDENGVLVLPGLRTIPLLGLTPFQIEQRLRAEPALEHFDVYVTILENEITGVSALEPFGYSVFEANDYGFEPVTTGPVPPDYVIGPGDSLRVQLFGNVNSIQEIEVTRDGILNLPELGPVTVAGLPFSELRRDLDSRVQEMLIGTQVSVTMGQLRTIRIFVLGDANRPGSYVINSLATISSALYFSGGISPVGTLRDIQLKRNGDIVSRFDLYDLLLNGDTSQDSRLQPGDVIFIPPVGAQVSVNGAVRRPAIYETRNGTSIADVIDIAGGLLPDAYPDGVTVERIDSGQLRTVIAVEADSAEADSTPASAGDIVTVPKVLPVLEDSVTLQGHVHRPGPYPWREGMRLTDLISSASVLKTSADADYVLIRREHPVTRRVHAVSANLAAAIVSPQSPENIVLDAKDTVFVFSLEFGRQRMIEPFLDELKLQGRFGEPYREVSISGQVQAPGTYPLEPGMRVSDLLRAGGNLSEEAYAGKAELVRYEITDGGRRETAVVDIRLDAILRGDVSADILLAEHDNLRISTIPEWDSLWTVELEGELKFPGSYRIRRGETLRQVIDRAGGLTNDAFAEGAIFLRESLREREQEQFEVLARRLEADLSSMSLETDDNRTTDVLSTGRTLLAQLRGTEAVGRLVIDLDRIVRGQESSNGFDQLELRDGDRLLIPKQVQEVTVIGETQQNTSHLYQPELSRSDYIAMSGGLTRRADKKLIYVVRASGAVNADNRSRWFGRKGGVEIRPGDTIVVPIETDRIRPLTLWANVTQILYQTAIAIAAVQTFNN